MIIVMINYHDDYHVHTHPRLCPGNRLLITGDKRLLNYRDFSVNESIFNQRSWALSDPG